MEGLYTEVTLSGLRFLSLFFFGLRFQRVPLHALFRVDRIDTVNRFLKHLE